SLPMKQATQAQCKVSWGQWLHGSLTLKFSTPSPTCSMSPAHSDPIMKGVFGGESIAPCLAIRSWKF
ncbi:unnamed protein product, partial [Heterotrigona itama]